jgi:hypothetical protein
MNSNAVLRFSSASSPISIETISRFHGVYALRRFSTRSQVISSMPCKPRTRDSIRLRCSSTSLRTHSITTSGTCSRLAQSIHTCLASSSAFTASITTAFPSLTCSAASVSATKYAAYPVSKLLAMPALIIEASIGSTEKIGSFRCSAILSARVLLPLPGRPDITISFALLIRDNYRVEMGGIAKTRPKTRLDKLLCYFLIIPWQGFHQDVVRTMVWEEIAQVLSDGQLAEIEMEIEQIKGLLNS